MDKAVIRVLLARKPYPDFEAENNKQGGNSMKRSTSGSKIRML